MNAFDRNKTQPSRMPGLRIHAWIFKAEKKKRNLMKPQGLRVRLFGAHTREGIDDN
jgi:hypothetical protein